MIKIYTDGAARGNPGPAVVGYVIFKKDKLLKKSARYIGKSTNNIAEYRAVINALRIAPKKKEIVLYSDSKLVVNQITGKFKVKKEHLKKLHDKVKELSAKLEIKFKWASRDTPGIAIVDSLINRELDKHV